MGQRRPAGGDYVRRFAPPLQEDRAVGSRLLALAYFPLCALLGAVCVPLANLQDAPLQGSWLSWLLPVVLVCLVSGMLSRWRPILPPPQPVTVPVAALVLGVLTSEAFGLAWLYTLQVFWEQTWFFCCTSDEAQWPPGMSVAGYILVFGVLGCITGLLALAGVGVVALLRRQFGHV